jgi:tetratricopeptide (TPR) repeat protein
MNCKKAQSLMLDFLYHELPSRKQKALERHLNKCAACAEELRNQQSTVSAFQGVDFENPPPELNEILKEMAVKELEQEALFSRKKSAAWYWKPTLASAAAAMLLVVALVYYRPQAKINRQMANEASAPQSAVIAQADKITPAAENEVGERSWAQNKVEPAEPESLLRRDTEAPALIGETAAALHEEMTEQPKDKAIPAPPLFDRLADENNVSGAGRLAEPAIKQEVYPASAPSEDRALSLDRAREGIALRKAQSYMPQTAEGAATSFAEPEMKANDVLSKGNEFFDDKDYGRAAMMYQEAIGLAPEAEKAADVRFRLARSYQELHRYDQALAEYLSIIDHNPDYPALAEVYLGAGDCYLALGQPSEAGKAYETVRDRFPEFRETALKKLTGIEDQSTGETPGETDSRKEIKPAE